MTLKQGEEVNRKFETLQDSIDHLKKHLDTVKFNFKKYQFENGTRLQSMYNAYWEQKENFRLKKEESDSFKVMYMANKIIHLEREETSRRTLNQSLTFSLITFVLVIFFASQAN